jgi:predicted amidohydrolase
MKICVVQPRYPVAGTIDSARACVAWMQMQLEGLQPQGQDLIVLPEYANVPGINDVDTMRTFAEGVGRAFVAYVADSSARLSCLITMGGVFKTDVGWQNQVMVFDGGKTPKYLYNKVHLTDVESNGLGLIPGNKVGVFDWQGIRLGFAVCFDMYFASYFEALAKHKVDVIVCPGYQRSESGDRIRLISGARALDTGAYVVRSSYAMHTPQKGGHSLVASPDGNIVVDAADAVGMVAVDIDPHLKFVKPASHGQPDVEHRVLIEAHVRPEVYATDGVSDRLS